MSERRFTIIDAMTIVAATAVGLAMARAYNPQFSGERLPDFLKRGWAAPSCLMVALSWSDPPPIVATSPATAR